MLGCGNSKLSEEMYDDGFRNITNVDYSPVVIDQMQRRHEASRPGMKWVVADVRELPFDADAFDITLDKGTMDAMMTTKGDVWVAMVNPASVLFLRSTRFRIRQSRCYRTATGKSTTLCGSCVQRGCSCTSLLGNPTFENATSRSLLPSWKSGN